MIVSLHAHFFNWYHFCFKETTKRLKILVWDFTGTFVIEVNATDADDATYGNSAKLVYSILQGQPYFSVEPETGESSKHMAKNIFTVDTLFRFFACAFWGVRKVNFRVAECLKQRSHTDSILFTINNKLVMELLTRPCI